MSEQKTALTTGTEETNNEQSTEGAKEFEAITSQEELDRIVQARIARERAKFADYDEMKAQAQKLKEFEDAQKTEAQKQQEALAEAQAQLAELTVAKTRAEVAAAKGVPAELLSGSTQEELEASADALIKFKGEKQQTARLVIPGEGKSPTGTASTTAEVFAEWSEGNFNSL